MCVLLIVMYTQVRCTLLCCCGVHSGRCLGTLTGHEDEVLDVGFDFTGQYLLSASADGTGRIYNSTTHQLISKLEGHGGEISKVSE